MVKSSHQWNRSRRPSNFNTEVLHSIEATHVGYVANPSEFNFSISVQAIGGASAKLTEMAVKAQEFDLALVPAQGSANEWDFKEIILRRCIVTSANPSNATINAAPVTSFSGVSLAAQVDSLDELPEFAPAD